MAIQLSDFVLTPGIIDATSLALSWNYGSISGTPITFNTVTSMTINVTETLSSGSVTQKSIIVSKNDRNDASTTINSVVISSVYSFSATIVVGGTTYSSTVSAKISPVAPLDAFTLADLPGTNEEENGWYSIYPQFSNTVSTNPYNYTVGATYKLLLTLFSSTTSNTNPVMTPLEVTIPTTQVQNGLAPFTAAELAGTDNYEYIIKNLNPTLKYNVAAKISQVITLFGVSYTIYSPLTNTIMFSTSFLPDAPDVSITSYNTVNGTVSITATLTNTGIANGTLGMRMYRVTGTSPNFTYTLLKDVSYSSAVINSFVAQTKVFNTGDNDYNNSFTFLPGTTYTVVIVAYNSSGSNSSIEETPKTSRQITFTTAIQPSAPTLTVVSATSTTVNLSWTTNIYTGIMSNYFNSYVITYTDADNANTTYTETVSGATFSTSTYTVTVNSAARQHKCNYKIRAVVNGPDTSNLYKASGLTISPTIQGSLSTNSAFATTYSIPTIPNNFAISHVPGECSQQAKLSWSIPTGALGTPSFPQPADYISNGLPIKKYNIYSVDSASGSVYTYVTSIVENNLTNYNTIINSLVNGQTYHFAITTETTTSGACSFAEILVESVKSATKSIVPFNIPAAPTVTLFTSGNHFVQLYNQDNSIVSDGVSRLDADVFFKPIITTAGSAVTISPTSYAKTDIRPFVINLPNATLVIKVKANYKNPNNATTFDTADSTSITATPAFSTTRFNVSGVSLSETGIAISNAGATVSWSKPILSGTDWTNSDLAFNNYNISLFDTTNPGTAAKTYNSITNMDTLTYTFTGLTNGTNYHAKISVTYNDTETSTQRTTDDVQSNTLIPVTYPAAPTNIVYNTFADKQISVSWTPPPNLGGASSVTNYTVSIHNNSIPATPVLIGSAYTTTSSNYTFTGLTNNIPYIVKVFTNTTGPNISQDIQSLLPLTSGNLYAFNTTVPTTTGLVATADDQAINLVWDTNTQFTLDGLPVEYFIYYNTVIITDANIGSATVRTAGTTASGDLSKRYNTISGLNNGTRYYIVVKAQIVNPNGPSTDKYNSGIGSNVNAVPLKSAVSGPATFTGRVLAQVAGSLTGSVRLDFSAGAAINSRVDGNEVTGYNVYKDGVKIPGDKITANFYIDTSLTLGQTYTYSYKYVTKNPNDLNSPDAESASSPTVSLNPFATPTAATNVKFSTITESGKLVVTWSAPTSTGGLDTKYKVVCTNTTNNSNTPTTANTSYQSITETTATFSSLTLGEVHSVDVTAFVVPSTDYGQTFTNAEKLSVVSNIVAITYDPVPNTPAFAINNAFTSVTEAAFTTNITYTEKPNTGLIASTGQFAYVYTDTNTNKTPTIVVTQLSAQGVLPSTATDVFTVPTAPINTTGDYWDVTLYSQYTNPNYQSYKSNFSPEASQYITSSVSNSKKIAPFGVPVVMFTVTAQNQSSEVSIANTDTNNGNFEYYTIRVTDDNVVDATGVSITHDGTITNSNTRIIYVRDAQQIGINGLTNGPTYRVYITVTVSNPLDPNPITQPATSSSALSFFAVTAVDSAVPSILTTRTPSTSTSSISGSGATQTITFNVNSKNFAIIGYILYIRGSDGKVYYFYGNANTNNSGYNLTSFPIAQSSTASTIQVKFGDKMGSLTVVAHALTVFNQYGASEAFFYDNGVSGNSFNST